MHTCPNCRDGYEMLVCENGTERNWTCATCGYREQVVEGLVQMFWPQVMV